MSRTLQDFESLVRELAASYELEIDLSPGIIRTAINRAVGEVYRYILPKRPYLYRRTATLADGAALPSDYLHYAGLAYIKDGTGKRTDFRYTPVAEIPAIKRNFILLGNAKNPALWISDKAIHTWPAAISGIQFEYWIRPLPMVDPTETSATPPDMEMLVARCAFERCLIVMLGEKDSLAVTQDKLQKVQTENLALFTEALGFLEGKGKV